MTGKGRGHRALEIKLPQARGHLGWASSYTQDLRVGGGGLDQHCLWLMLDVSLDQAAWAGQGLGFGEQWLSRSVESTERHLLRGQPRGVGSICKYSPVTAHKHHLFSCVGPVVHSSTGKSGKWRDRLQFSA